MNSLSFLVAKFMNYIDLCVPLKTVNIGHRYAIREKWMTKGLLKSSLNLNKFRNKISKNNINVSIVENKSYRNLYTRLIRIAKAAYYSEQIEQHRGNISKTWIIQNQLLGKNQDISKHYAASIGTSSKQFNEYLIGNCPKS